MPEPTILRRPVTLDRCAIYVRDSHPTEAAAAVNQTFKDLGLHTVSTDIWTDLGTVLRPDTDALVIQCGRGATRNQKQRLAGAIVPLTSNNAVDCGFLGRPDLLWLGKYLAIVSGMSFSEWHASLNMPIPCETVRKRFNVCHTVRALDDDGRHDLATDRKAVKAPALMEMQDFLYAWFRVRFKQVFNRLRFAA